MLYTYLRVSECVSLKRALSVIGKMRSKKAMERENNGVTDEEDVASVAIYVHVRVLLRSAPYAMRKRRDLSCSYNHAPLYLYHPPNRRNRRLKIHV